jgi:hypothetical protein
MFEVHVKGFKTEAQAKAFIDAYAFQGQQVAAVWYECRHEEGTIDVTSMEVDMSKYPLKCVNNVIEVYVEPINDLIEE